MMYGAGIPLLFPIAALSYLISWLVERYHVAYTCQAPPALDDRLTKNAITMLSYSPILFLLNGYWMTSNKQIFDSQVNEKTISSEKMFTGHTLSTTTDLNQALPLLIIGACIFVIVFMTRFFPLALQKWGFTFKGDIPPVDENLPNFFEAVKLADADWMVHEN